MQNLREVTAQTAAGDKTAASAAWTQVEVCTRIAESNARPAHRHVSGRAGAGGFHRDPHWLVALCRGLRHKPYLLVARQGDQPVGVLPLALVKSRLFGRFLVSLPYVNSAGVVAEDAEVAGALVDRAVELADQLDVRHLELRHERPVEHPALGAELTSKVHMRLALPVPPGEAQRYPPKWSVDELWKSFKPKVRNQVRKGEKAGLSVHWGGPDLLGEFYGVFARNMRDLGTPVFGRRLFASILAQFPHEAELCVVRMGRRAVAAALLVHGRGVTEVPSASSLRPYNWTNANMVMYWHLLRRAIERGQATFDFGRSSPDSSTFRFKKQWGARPEPAVWQYYVRKGTASDMRIESGKYDRLIAMWRRLPVCATRLIGPVIVRGIP